MSVAIPERLPWFPVAPVTAMRRGIVMVLRLLKGGFNCGDMQMQVPTIRVNLLQVLEKRRTENTVEERTVEAL